MLLTRDHLTHAVLVLLVLTAGLAPYLGRWGAAALTVVSAWWLWVDGPVEGRTLIPLTRSHAVTEADVASIVGFGLAALVLATSPRRHRRDRRARDVDDG